MAKNTNKKTETPETPKNESEATDEAQNGAANALTAFDNLTDLEVAYKAMKKTLKGEAAESNKAAAIDLVTDVADEIVDELIASITERGMKFTNFTIRYAAKNDTGKGVGDTRGIATVIGAVRLTVEELKVRDEENAATYGELLGDTVDKNAGAEEIITAKMELADWITDHPSFTVPSDEENAADEK